MGKMLGYMPSEMLRRSLHCDNYRDASWNTRRVNSWINVEKHIGINVWIHVRIHIRIYIGINVGMRVGINVGINVWIHVGMHLA